MPAAPVGILHAKHKTATAIGSDRDSDGDGDGDGDGGIGHEPARFLTDISKSAITTGLHAHMPRIHANVHGCRMHNESKS
jgi:hypothetical protein